ncbi:MAG: hypothetical protein FWC83_02860, partial [Alphaproteobacteria bacterium]|nr:hypothetical protein [Alphaproteobacteria bacterium]
QYAETHTRDDVTSVRARMVTNNEARDRMGEIRFTERDAGLAMSVSMRDMRPNTEYRLMIHDTSKCTKAQLEARDRNCMVRRNVNLPHFTTDANGRISKDYMYRGLSANELVNNRITVYRLDDRGDRVRVSRGTLEKRRMMGL